MRFIFSTDDWFARHPGVCLAVIAAAYVLVCTLEQMP